MPIFCVFRRLETFVAFSVLLPFDAGLAAVLSGVETGVVTGMVTVKPTLCIVLVRSHSPCWMASLDIVIYRQIDF